MGVSITGIASKSWQLRLPRPLLVIKQDEMKLIYDGDLFDAIELGDLESVKMYWQEGIEIDYQEKGGNSMLMLAVSYGFRDIVEYLLSKQPNLDLRNDQGQTAADIAKEKGYDQILNMMRGFK